MLIESFPPEAGDHAEILILGSMPGKASLDAQQYYAHPRNFLWPFVCAVAGRDVPDDYAERLMILRAQKLALWDVLKYCQRDGSLDANIVRASEQANDFAALFARLPALKRICFNGKKAEQSFMRYVLGDHCLDVRRFELISLPSTSPANASIPTEIKRSAWLNALTF